MDQPNNPSSPLHRLRGKIAVISAAAGGIGSATALRLAQEGANAVVIIDIVPEIHEFSQALRETEAVVKSIQLDCTDEAAVVRVFAEIEQEFGRIDILVNAVGSNGSPGDFNDSKPQTWREVIDATLIATMLCTRQAAPGMCARRYGRILNIGSSIALLPTLQLADYAAAKGGIVSFTRALALEFAPFGVTVNTVSPGPIRTPGTDRLAPDIFARSVKAIPLGFVGEPFDVANAVAFLVSDEARYITGQNLAVNGGRALN